MEIYERIRELRKNHLKITQSEFANRLGVTRAVIKNIELDALARPEQKLSLYKLICSEFNVNEDWLLNGNEPMFTINEEDEYSVLIDQIMSGENEFAKNIFKSFAKLDTEDWKALQHLIETLSSANTKLEDTDPASLVPDTPEELEAMYPPVDMDLVKKNAG